MPNAPPDALVERFKEDLGQLEDTANARLGVAVSGGADSLALLLLCNGAYPGQTFAATVDHGLRPESKAEAAFVAEICSRLAIQHKTLIIREPSTGNTADWARKVRYRALDEWAAAAGLAFYMTAHHADDQLETMLMRLNRGSGVSGLAGIRSRQGKAVRPLLTWRHSELGAFVAGSGIDPVNDPYNRDERFDRARLRKALAGADWLDPIRAARSAAALADAENALDWYAATLFALSTRRDGETLFLDAITVPKEMARRLVLRCLQAFVSDASPRADELTRLVATLRAGKIGTLCGVRCMGGESWSFFLGAPRRKN